MPAGSTILVIGGAGLIEEVTKAGFVATDSAEDSPAAVIQGYFPEIGWVHLAEAAFALHTGIPWVATNTDWTIPVARGTAPGNGTLVSAVHTAVSSGVRAPMSMRSEEHTSELQSHGTISYAVFCLKKKK